MAKNYVEMSKEIIENIGGVDNVNKVMHCMTRLRMIIKDESKVNLIGLKQIEGVMDVVISGGQYQVVIGTDVPKLYQAIIKNNSELSNDSIENSKEKNAKGKNSIFAKLMETISSIFVPVLGAMAGAGMLKGVLIALSSVGVMSADGGTYLLLYSLADAFFYFMPMILAFSAAKKFGANQYVAFVVVAAMIYPNILTALNNGTSISLFRFIPVKLMNYTSSVIPPIIVVYVLSKIEQLLKKIIPSIVSNIFVPLLSMLIVFPIAIIVVGPVVSVASTAVADAFTWIYNLCPPVAGAFLGGIWPLTIVFGIHWGFFPIVVNNIGVNGYDTLLPLTIGSNFAAAGAALGVFLKTKNKKVKEVSGTAAFSALIGGVTEPAIYGVNLKYKRPFYISCIFSAVAGAIVGLAGAQYTTIMAICIFTMPAVAVFKGGLMMVIAAIAAFLGTTITTYLVGFKDTMVNE